MNFPNKRKEGQCDRYIFKLYRLCCQNKQNMDELKLLEELRRVPTLSGFEDKGRESIAKILSPYFDTYRKAGVAGMLFTKKCGRENAPKILIDAHLDEIGLIVTDIAEDGTLTVASLGGTDPRTYTASRYTVHADRDIEAVTVKMPYRIQKGAKKLPQVKDLRLFTGKTKEELTEQGVAVGVAVSAKRSTVSLGSEQFYGSYMDDKACIVVAVVALEELKGKKISCDIQLLLSGQEESYGAGFVTGAYSANPDEILVVDVDLGNTPETDGAKTVKMGEGPSVAISVETNRTMTKALLKLAKEREIPVQPAMNVKRTGTNASGTPFLMGGVPTATIGLPLKYMHTPVETLYKKDLLNTGKLIAAYIDSHYGEKEDIGL